MIGDEKYYAWLKGQAKKFGQKFGLDWRDLLQEFLLSVAEGDSAKFEHVWFEVIRREYKRGITGKTDASEFSYDETLLGRVQDNQRGMGEIEFLEYLLDLKSIVSETEFKLVCMLLVGFDKGEVFEQSNLPRRELMAFWRKIGIQNYRTATGR